MILIKSAGPPMSLWGGNTRQWQHHREQHTTALQPLTPGPATAQWLGRVKHSTPCTHHNVTGSGSVTVTGTCVPLSVIPGVT